MSAKTDLAASVAARLLNRARETGDDYQALLTSYALERFLYRLGASDLRDRFVLKGAMLFRLWSELPYRATRDLDLLRRGDAGFEAIRDDLNAIVATSAPPDGFLLAVSPSLLAPGSRFLVPQPGVRAVATRLRAPVYETADDVTGSIAIRRVTNAEVVATVVLKSATLGCSHRGTVTFVSSSRPSERVDPHSKERGQQ